MSFHVNLKEGSWCYKKHQCVVIYLPRLGPKYYAYTGFGDRMPLYLGIGTLRASSVAKSRPLLSVVLWGPMWLQVCLATKRPWRFCDVHLAQIVSVELYLPGLLAKKTLSD